MFKNQKSLTPEMIEEVKSSYPPLTEDEFRYSKVACGFPSAKSTDGSKLLVSLLKSDKKYFLLSSMSHKCYIKHRIPTIPNQAPTIEQWFQELRVYPNELDLPTIPKCKSKQTLYANPKPEFFTKANENFATSANARHKKDKGWFAYYYYVEPESNRILHLDEPEARQLYCKKYEQSITFEKSPARPVFEELWRTCMARSRSIPIVIRNRGIENSLDKPIHIADKYHDYNHCFSATYCLVEMLVKYPNLDQCIWNVEVAPKESPPHVKVFRPRPAITYNNPHKDKVYECDKPKPKSKAKSKFKAKAVNDDDTYIADTDYLADVK